MPTLALLYPTCWRKLLLCGQIPQYAESQPSLFQPNIMKSGVSDLCRDIYSIHTGRPMMLVMIHQPTHFAPTASCTFFVTYSRSRGRPLVPPIILPITLLKFLLPSSRPSTTLATSESISVSLTVGISSA